MREFKALPCAFAVRFLSLAPSLSPCCFPRQRAVGAACVGARSGLFFWRPQVCGLYPFPCDFEEMPLLSWRKENKVVGSREVFSSLKSSGYSALQLLFQVLSVPQVGRSCAPGPFGFAEMSTILKWFGREDKEKEDKDKEKDKEEEKEEKEKAEGEKEKDKKKRKKKEEEDKGDGEEDRSSSSSDSDSEDHGSDKDEKEDKD
ncbi:uncharacterized protein LOC141749647 isoform X2 [Larus michahellis]|uniref:uncharacterized protein LOC141749647 isoform X2 n=1 Tax=Larus michahellis TaxID=119627 RepID=UPI003D9AB5C5